MGWDQALLDVVVRHRTDALTTAAEGLMAAGQPAEAYGAAALAGLAIAWALRGWPALVASLLAAAFAAGLAEGTKDLIGRARPSEGWALVPASGLAMPSSIAALTSAAAIPFVLLGLHRATRFGRALAATLVAGVALVGVAMVYLGAHWPSDVLVGWVLGGGVGLLASRALDRWARVLRRRIGAGTASSQ